MVTKRDLRAVERVRKALAGAHHHTLESWRAMRDGIRGLDDQELILALEFERLGKRRRAQMNALDAELRRRRGETADHRYRVETGGKDVTLL